MDKNDQTIATYRDKFAMYVARTPTSVGSVFEKWIDAFVRELPAGAHVFELGSATGRDARYLQKKGIKVFCTDVIPEALELLSKEGFETAYYDFRDVPDANWLSQFDGVFASGVLLHAPGEVFKQVLWHVLDLLKPGGAFAFSLKTGIGQEMSEEKMEAPRFFKYYTLKELAGILAEYPIDVRSIELVEDGKWLQTIFVKR